jgi:ferredoxin
LAPDIFEIGTSDVVHVADGEVPEHRKIDVEAAVDQCPKAALRVVD